MQLNPVASTVLVVFYLVTSLTLVVVLGIFLYSIVKLNAKLESLEQKIDPLLHQAEEFLTVTSAQVTSLGERTEGILTHGEAVAEDVHEKIDKTTSTVQNTINAPIIGLNSVLAGLTHGVQTFTILQRQKKRNKVITPLDPVILSQEPLSVSTGDTVVSAEATTRENLIGSPAILRAGKGH
ncbi:MAG: hypothetical protein V4671_24835 [Armatimonadota bacterium]